MLKTVFTWPRAQHLFAAAAFAITFASGSHAAQSTTEIPDFSTPDGGWQMINSNRTNYVDPETGPKPISNDPRYPHVGNLQPGQKTDRVTDVSNPMLKPWAAAQIAKTNEAVLRGRTPFVATSLCWPGGVPAQLLVPTKVTILQTPDMVWMFWERDHLVRKVYLNQKHSSNPKPQWYGESVGHYEGKDTLVIDTIGLLEHPLSYVDNFRTPHTKELHVQERWKMIDNGQRVEVSFQVSDPGTFNTPWGGLMRYRRTDGAMEEFVCAENNDDKFNLDDYSVPTEETPDF